MSIFVSGFVAAWLDAVDTRWQDQARTRHSIMAADGSDYVGDGGTDSVTPKNWSAVTITRNGAYLDFQFHYADLLFATDCSAEKLLIVSHRPLPLVLLSAAREDARLLIHSDKVELPHIRLRDYSISNGITLMSLISRNRRIG